MVIGKKKELENNIRQEDEVFVQEEADHCELLKQQYNLLEGQLEE